MLGRSAPTGDDLTLEGIRAVAVEGAAIGRSAADPHPPPVVNVVRTNPIAAGRPNVARATLDHLSRGEAVDVAGEGCA